MKKLIVFIAMTFAFISITDAAIYRSVKDGRDNGKDSTTSEPRDATYNSVTTWFDNTIILCDGPGAESCPKGLVTPNTPEEKNVKYALDQIYSGILNGQEVRNGLQLEWTATGSDPDDDSTIISWDSDTESKPTGTPFSALLNKITQFVWSYIY
jgi:hypothetical protein